MNEFPKGLSDVIAGTVFPVTSGRFFLLAATLLALALLLIYLWRWRAVKGIDLRRSGVRSRSAAKIAALQKRFPALLSFLQARVSPEGYLGLHLTLGIVILVGATWVFGGIAEDVAEGDALTLLDVNFSVWLHSQASAWLTSVMRVITQLGSMSWVLTVSGVLAGYWAWRKQFDQLMTLALTVPGGIVLNILLKAAFHRTRPHFENPLLTLSTYSFPSGHTMAAMLLYGLLATVALAKVHTWPWRIGILVMALGLIALIGFSRIYLGAHYLSDVLAALAEGLAWLAICVTAVDTVRRRKMQKTAMD